MAKEDVNDVAKTNEYSEGHVLPHKSSIIGLLNRVNYCKPMI